jgi:hypothetical protein
MKPTDRSTRQKIAWLRDCIAVIDSTPPLWSWWPLLHICAAEAARLERSLAQRPAAPAEIIDAEVIDLAEWRRRKSAPPARSREQAGGAA